MGARRVASRARLSGLKLVSITGIMITGSTASRHDSVPQFPHQAGPLNLPVP